MKQALGASLRALKGSPALAVSVLAWALAAILLLVRVPYGASGTDEAFYSAMPYGFVLGNKPYVDELAFHQNAAILLVPLYRVYVWVRGTDGIMLFNRWLYVAYLALCSWLAYRVVSKLADRVAACWTGALILAFGYFNLLALSYNTLGAFGFLCGVLLSVLSLFEKPGKNLFVASLFFTSAAFSYPTLAFGVLPTQLLSLWYLRKRAERADFRRGLWAVGVGGVIALASAVAFLAWVTEAGIKRALEFSRSMGYAKYSLLEKLDFSNTPCWEQRWHLVAFGLFLTLFPSLLRLKRAIVPLSLLAPPLMLVLYYLSLPAYATTHASIFLNMLPLLAPACLWRTRAFAERRLVLELLWLPGVVTMIAVTYSSANGPVVAHLATLPTLIAGVIGLWALTRELEPAGARTELAARLLLPGFCAAALMIELHSLYASVYGTEAPLSEHRARVKSGPLKGARTTRERAALVQAVDRDLKSIEEPGKTLSIFDDFSNAYMTTSMRPRTFTHWVVWVFEPNYLRSLLQSSFSNPQDQPDFVLLMGDGFKPRHAFRPFEKNYEVVINRPELGYWIEKRVRSNVIELPPVRPPRRRKPH